MPYARVADLPPQVRERYSPRCQEVYRTVFNDTYENKDEAAAFRAAATAAGNCMDAIETKKAADVVTLTAPIAKRDRARQIAYGVVLEPRTVESPDTQGDWYTPDDIEKAAHYFMAQVTLGNGFSDVMHDGTTRAGYPVESFIAPVDMPLGEEVVKAGSWVIGMHYPDRAIWQRIVEGEFGAFSVGGSGLRE